MMEGEKKQLEAGTETEGQKPRWGEDDRRQRLGPLGFPLGQCGRRCRGGARGFEKKRDEKIAGIGGMSAAMPFRKREMICGRACAT
jgi:hypothetical protein